MSTEVLLVQMLVLAFTGALWWIARRDLAARVPPPAAPSPPPADPSPAEDAAAQMAELEQLCTTLETLVTSLARRLDAVERAAGENAAQAQPVAAVSEAAVSEAVPDALPRRAEPQPDPRYAPVYALVHAGVSDPVEIARQTGLGRGEVELLLSLRDRRASDN